MQEFPSFKEVEEKTRFKEVRIFESLESTNSYLAGEAIRGAADGLVVIAAFQEKGKGRLGRTWVSKPGESLLMSVLLRPTYLPIEASHLITASVALAAKSALFNLCGVLSEIKWPNDLVIPLGTKLASGEALEADHKIGGILAEVGLSQNKQTTSIDWLVVGVGVNINWSGPIGSNDQAPLAISQLLISGKVASYQELAAKILFELDPKLNKLETPFERVEVASEFRAACSTLGQMVKVATVDDKEGFTGRAADITAEGHLVVETPICLKTVTAGDIYHLKRIN